MRIVNKIAYKIMLATALKPVGFNEIAKGYFINPCSLSDWLYYLQQCGLIQREVHPKPIRVMYKLTPKGKAVLEHVYEVIDCEPKLSADEGYK